MSAARPSPAAGLTAVIPSLDDRDLFEQHLPALLEELGRHGLASGGPVELLVVDDTGEGTLAAWIDARFGGAPGVRVRALAGRENLGYARALLAGVEAAEGELVLCLNPDLRVHPGCLAPLVAALADPEVHSAVPRVLLHGDPERVESVVELARDRGHSYVRQRGLEGQAARFAAPGPVAYAIGGAMLLRRADFLAGGGYDPLYEPFYYEDVDLGVAAWRAGRRVAYVPAAVVEHHHRGTIRRRVDEDLVRAVIERNRLLFQWRFTDEAEEAERLLESLERYAADAYLRDCREELVWLALALDRLAELRASRARLGPAARTFREVERASAPTPGPEPGA